MSLFLVCRLINLIMETVITGSQMRQIHALCCYFAYAAVCSKLTNSFTLTSGCAAYGTYVVFGTHVQCKEDEEIIWDPKNEVKVLVCLTWCFQLVLL